MLIKVYNVFLNEAEIDHYECGGCGTIYEVQPANLPAQCIVCGSSFEEKVAVEGDGT